MHITARINNQAGQHDVRLTTNDQSRTLTIPPKTTGFGSSASGGELLFLALATCYCNDIYREAEKRNIRVQGVEVKVEGDFGALGEPADNVVYHACVMAHGDEEVIRSIMQYTDQVAEIQNTLRRATPVTLARRDIVSV